MDFTEVFQLRYTNNIFIFFRHFGACFMFFREDSTVLNGSAEFEHIFVLISIKPTLLTAH